MRPTVLRALHATIQLWKKRSSSSAQWINRQLNDEFARRSKDDQYNSRAAYKLLDLHKKHRLFKPNMTVVDLGFAPGSWTQVAVEKTRPAGKVVGVDILFCAPPQGASSVQGNFLSKSVQDQVKRLVADPLVGKPVPETPIYYDQQEMEEARLQKSSSATDRRHDLDESYIDMERDMSRLDLDNQLPGEYNVDIVLSDMCDPLPQETGFWLQSINDPYYRMANTSGLQLRDHAKSIDLCDAALIFAIETLRPGGHFVCKFFTGSEDKDLEARLKRAFAKVRREKPEASRKESREMYFIALKKKNDVTIDQVFA